MPLGHAVVAAYLISQWIFLSSCIILYNKYILTSAGFPFPVTLVLMHMIFVSLCAAAWKQCGLVEVPSVSLHTFITSFLPVGICQAASLGLGNAAYLFISVAFIQMLKASTPVAVLLVSFAFGLEQPNTRLSIYIALVSTGILTACLAQVQVSAPGMILQMSAVITEAFRLCLVNILLTSRGLKLSPIASLYYIGPACVICLSIPWALLEANSVCSDSFKALRAAGAPLLLSNASIAFLLNLATMALIKHTSALTLNVSGVFKDLLLIIWSVCVSGAMVTPTQYFGYFVAMCGVLGYSHYKRNQPLPATPPAVSNDAEKDCESELLTANSDDKS